VQIIFAPRAWQEYTDWQLEDKKTLRRINALIKDIERNGNTGIGKPNPLKVFEVSGSRRIDDTNRLVYKLSGAGAEQELMIAQCATHYE